MKQYLDACRYILEYGEQRPNRTGTDAIGVQGMMMKFNMADGFPLLTTKRVNFKAVVAELFGFILGVDNAKDFRELGTKIWDANANENRQWLINPWRKGTDDLGRIYGVQWRKWEAPGPDLSGGRIDQLAEVVNDLRNGIDNRREIVLAWNPAEIDRMALPPCHLLFQFGIQGDRLNLGMYQRSCDFPLGVPFNIASYALLLHIVARIAGLRPGVFTHFLWDCHIYVNQVEGIETQLERTPKRLPQLELPGNLFNLEDIGTSVLPSDIDLTWYDPAPAIDFPFSV